MDLVIRNATLPDGSHGIDMGMEGERIVAVEQRMRAQGARDRGRPRKTRAHRS